MQWWGTCLPASAGLDTIDILTAREEEDWGGVTINV